MEWSRLLRRKHGWTTVFEMAPQTHPAARLMMRSVRPGSGEAFDAALTARTQFYDGAEFPLPLDGFAVVDSDPGDGLTTAQVAFATSWPDYHTRNHFPLWRKAQSPEVRALYDARKQALMVTMDRAEFYDGTYLPMQSYPTAAPSLSGIRPCTTGW